VRWGFHGLGVVPAGMTKQRKTMDRFVGALEEASGQSILTGNRMRRKGMLKVIDGIVAAACLGRNATRVGFEIVS